MSCFPFLLVETCKAVGLHEPTSKANVVLEVWEASLPNSKHHRRVQKAIYSKAESALPHSRSPPSVPSVDRCAQCVGAWNAAALRFAILIPKGEPELKKRAAAPGRTILNL